MQLHMTEEALEYARRKGGRIALDLIAPVG